MLDVFRVLMLAHYKYLEPMWYLDTLKLLMERYNIKYVRVSSNNNIVVGADREDQKELFLQTLKNVIPREKLLADTTYTIDFLAKEINKLTKEYYDYLIKQGFDKIPLTEMIISESI